MEILLFTLMVIYSRGTPAEKKEVFSLITFILERVENPCVISRCKLLVKRIEAHTKGKTCFSPNIFPLSTLPHPYIPPNADYILSKTLADSCFKKLQTTPVCNSEELSWIQVAASSSPIDIQIAHRLDAACSTVVCFFRFIHLFHY